MKQVFSDYYESYIDEYDFEDLAKPLYFQWMRNNNQTPEIKEEDGLFDLTTGQVDHVLYHAEMEGFTIPTRTDPLYAKGGGVDYESMSKQELVDSYMKKVSAHLDKLTDEEVIDEYKDWFDVWDEFEEEDSHKSISQLKQELLDDEENAKLDYDKDELIYIQDSYAKGGLVKKSDFTMLGLGALGGMLIAILKK
jgi:hypothetical protein